MLEQTRCQAGAGRSRQEQAVTCRAIKECSIDNCSTLQRMCQHCTVVQRCVFNFYGSCVTSNCKVRSIVTQIAASPGMHTGTASTAGEHALPHLKYSRLGAHASCREHRPFNCTRSGSSRMSARCMHARCKHQQSGMWKASHIFNPSQPEASSGTMPSSFSLTHKRRQVWRGSRLPAGAAARHLHPAGSSQGAVVPHASCCHDCFKPDTSA